jgi:hypothetical protein
MKVELLWWDGCPSYPETLADLERVLGEEGVEADIQMIEVQSDEQARAERFPGSPTGVPRRPRTPRTFGTP